MRRYKARFLATLLIEVLLLGGCGSAPQETKVELIEPVAANAAYRPVELGTIGETQVLYGTVVPQEYGCYYDTSVNIKEIVVDIGDYVDAGDIIAHVDIDSAKEELEDLSRQLENLQQNFQISTQISELEILQIQARMIPVEDILDSFTHGDEELEKALLSIYDSDDTVPDSDGVSDAVSGNDATGGFSEDELKKLRLEYELTLLELINQREADIATAQENLRYDKLLHEYRVSTLQETINDKQKIIKDGTLRASHSGYVVYVKNIGLGTEASAYENIAVLADPEETYIELDKTIDNYSYKNYEVKQVNLAGKAYDVTELSYGVEAEILAKASGRYPRVRLICPEVPNLAVGEMYPILYQKTRTEEVPVIGLDSLEGEEDTYFVYVKDANGEREKRYVTIGDSDKYYAEILDGLQVGELVYYESDASMPAEYTEYTVSLSDYNIQNLSRSYDLADEQVTWYESEKAGIITEFVVKIGDKVETGDLLYVMLSDSGRAALAEAGNNISRENTTYEETIKRLDKSLAEEKNGYAKEILSLQKELETINHAYRLSQLEETYHDMAEHNNGNGEVRVYAKESGTIARIPVLEFMKSTENIEVAKGTKVLSMGNEADDKLLVEMEAIKDASGRVTERNYTDNIAEVGERIRILAGDYEYEGVCVGWTAHLDTNLKKYYVSETKDGPQISFCTGSGYQAPAFYVELEDEVLYQNLPKGKMVFSYVSMDDVVVVPTALVYEETNAKNPTKTDYYVWRVVGDELVKQYVLINKTYSDVNNTLILSGVEEHDVLAREK